MTNHSLKIFLSYHKDSPFYKSDIFDPIQVGTDCNPEIEGITKDNTGDNISRLNPYYCELTGQYWVLKNYLDNCNEEYIGFAHYRRLPDLLNISEADFPSVYGMNYSQSVELFNNMNNADLYDKIKDFDIILPCTVYMYKNTVNPLHRENEPHYNVYDHFRTEHNSNLLDILEQVISEDYNDYIPELRDCFMSEKSHFYNIYIMKTDILKQFLDWEFCILEKIGDKIGGWTQPKYRRMAGFVGETLINIWLNKHNEYKVGYTPIYMIDFEAEYIEKANSYHKLGMYSEEIEELYKLLEITSDKFYISSAILDVAANIENYDIDSVLKLVLSYAKSGEDYFKIALCLQNISNFDSAVICEIYEKAIGEKMYAESYLKFAENTHNMEHIHRAWKNLLQYDLSQADLNKYEKFMNVYNMVNG